MKSTPSPMLRSEFELRGGIARARAYVTSLGAYELYLNGQRVGDALFTPGWTSYEKRLQYQTYDVTALLRPDRNAVGAVLGDGWYRRESFNGGNRRNNGKPLALLVQLEVTYADGQTQTVVSDADWRTATGPIRRSELYNGEVYDARLERPGWATAAYDDRDWTRGQVVAPPSAALIATVGPPVRRIAELTPVRIFQNPAGTTVVDMGQNLVGRVRLRVRGARGTTVTLRHAETLDRDSSLYTEILRTAEQQVRYTLKGQGEEVFEPHFTVQGFRYVGVEGYPGELTPHSLTGVVIHSDMEPIGTFETSDPLLNQLQHNIVWTQKGNFLEVPTDCPQRDERLGWTGDAHHFSATAAFNMHVAGLFTRWLGDLALDQTADGAVPWEVPRTLFGTFPVSAILQGGGRASTDTRLMEAAGTPEYGDAATIVPWNLYLAYGDTGILRSQYASMARWVEYERGRAGEDYLWDGDFTFGDWLDFSTTDPTKRIKFGATSDELIATASYAHSVDILQRTATVLGNAEDAVRYGALLARIREAFHRRFVAADGRVGEGTQAAYAFALGFDLLPDSVRPRAARWLAEEVRSRGHVTTGVAGTPYLLPVLSRFGYHDEAYRLITRREFPSWLYPITRGATTIWERWNTINPDGSFPDPEMNSFNHPALGSVGAWMYQVMAGLNSDPAAPGYKHSRIQPVPGGGLTRVRASLETMYGRLSSAWTLQNGRFTLAIVVPPNTRATVRLPSAQVAQVQESGRWLTDAPGVESHGQDGDAAVIEVGSGHYQFSYPYSSSDHSGDR